MIENHFLRNPFGGPLLRIAKYCGLAPARFQQGVTIFARQPLLRRFCTFRILQNISNRLMNHSENETPGCIRIELLRLVCHVSTSAFCTIESTGIAKMCLHKWLKANANSDTAPFPLVMNNSFLTFLPIRCPGRSV